MIRTKSIRESIRFGVLLAACTATITLLPSPAFAAQGAHLSTNAAGAPLLVLTRGKVPMAPAMVSSLSKKAGTPLLLTRSIGADAYLMRPAHPATAQGLHAIATRLATHPNVLGAQIYKQAAPVYMLAPAGHRVTLDGARLAGSTTPIVRYQWRQILGPHTGIANTTQPNVTFLARQAATPGAATSDPAAINPGDLTAPPQQLQCAISAASAPKIRINSPVVLSKKAFMCDSGGSGAAPPGASATPPDSGMPSTPILAGAPPSDTGMPGSGAPPSDTAAPPNNFVPPAGFDNPSPGTPTGGAPGGPGGGMCIGNCIGGSGNCIGNCIGHYGPECIGNCMGGGGGGSGGMPGGLLGGLSVRTKAANGIRTISPADVIGYRLIATDSAGVAHARNIYVGVHTNTTAPAQAAQPAALPAKVKTRHPGFWSGML